MGLREGGDKDAARSRAEARITIEKRGKGSRKEEVGGAQKKREGGGGDLKGAWGVSAEFLGKKVEPEAEKRGRESRSGAKMTKEKKSVRNPPKSGCAEA